MVLGVCIQGSCAFTKATQQTPQEEAMLPCWRTAVSVSAVTGLSVTVVLCASGYVGLILF